MSTPPTKPDFRRIAARMRAELDRAASALVSFEDATGKRCWSEAKLAGRPKELAELVVKATLMRGRWQVVLPGLEEFGAQVGIGKNHIRGVFHVLECARMVDLARGKEGWTLTIFPHSGEWQGVTWRYEEKALLAYLAALDRAPGQVQGELLPPEEVETTARPAFTRAAAEASCASAERGTRNAEPPPVPEMGTSSRNGNSPCSNRVNRAEEVLDSIKSNRIEGRTGLWADDYVTQKLARVPALARELQEARTPTARRFIELHGRNPDRAHAWLAQAVEMRNPGAWLNRVLENEGKMQGYKPVDAKEAEQYRTFDARPHLPNE